MVLRDPLRLSHFLLSSCLARGVNLYYPSHPLSITTTASGHLSSITITSPVAPSETIDIPCSRLIITAGAWTPTVFKTLFPKARQTIPIAGLAGHSLLIRSPRWSVGDELQGRGGCHAVFTNDSQGYSPEVFSRVGGEIYIAGLNSATLSLPKVATDRVIDSNSTNILRKTATRLLGKGEDEIDDLEILREGLCFRPVASRGFPLVGNVEDAVMGVKTEKLGGVWIAAGHGPWGISLSLGTGKVVAEMVEGRPLSADVSGLAI
jgi:glycine/D-amino acid oxidase-like deaminating enzyme